MAVRSDSEPPNPHEFNIDLKSFVTDMGTDLKLVVLFALLACLSIYLPILNETPLRSALGLIMVLFIPGYALIAALFVRKVEISGIERIALSFGLSIAVVPLIGLGLNFTSWGIRLDPIVVALTAFTLLCVLTANKRRHDLPPEDSFSVDFSVIYSVAKREIFPESEGKLDRILTIILIISIILSICVLAYVIVVPKQGEKFTEFYILGPEGKAENYPTYYHLGEEKPLIVGVVNHEYRNVTYDLIVKLNDSSSITEIYADQITLANNQTWEKKISIKPDRIGYRMEIEFDLYADRNMTAPYRNLHLWVDVI